MTRKVNEVMTIYQITVKATFDNTTELRNIHHYEFFGYTPTTSQLQEAVDAIDTAYKTNLQSDFSLEVTFTGYEVRRVDVGNLPTADFQATAGSWSGTNASDPLPTQLAALVTWKGITVFPRTTRSYMFPFTETANTNQGILLASQITRLETFANAMLTLAITGDVDADKQAVKYGGDPRAVIDANDVLNVVVSPIWATQRRRRIGVGI